MTAEAAVGYEIGVQQFKGPLTIGEGGKPFAVVPSGLTLQDVSAYLPVPVRIQQSQNFFDVDSFAAYLKDFGYGGSKIFASMSESKLTAILDYHTLESASWNEHKAYLACAKSDDWNDWIRQDNKPMSQVAFAEFIEEHEVNFVEPQGAAMLTLAQNLEVNKSVIFKSAKRLSDGQTQFEYIEDIQDQTKGQIKIPAKLILGLQPFKFSKGYKVTARLRYRLADGKVTFTYALDAPEKIVEDAFRDVVKEVAEATDITPYLTA